MAIYTGAGGYLTYAHSPNFGLSFVDIYKAVNQTNANPSSAVSIDDYDGTWDDDGYWGAIQAKTSEVRLYGGSAANGGAPGASNTNLAFNARPRPRRPVSNGITFGSTYTSGGVSYRTIYLSLTDNGNYGDLRFYGRQGSSSSVDTTWPGSFITSGWGATNSFAAIRYRYYWIACVRRNWDSGGGIGYSRSTNWYRYIS